MVKRNRRISNLKHVNINNSIFIPSSSSRVLARLSVISLITGWRRWSRTLLCSSKKSAARESRITNKCKKLRSMLPVSSLWYSLLGKVQPTVGFVYARLKLTSRGVSLNAECWITSAPKLCQFSLPYIKMSSLTGTKYNCQELIVFWYNHFTFPM